VEGVSRYRRGPWNNHLSNGGNVPCFMTKGVRKQLAKVKRQNFSEYERQVAIVKAGPMR
jgi:hypothetical protein